MQQNMYLSFMYETPNNDNALLGTFLFLKATIKIMIKIARLPSFLQMFWWFFQLLYKNSITLRFGTLFIVKWIFYMCIMFFFGIFVLQQQ